MEESTKKHWDKPELTVYGSVEEITANKDWGFSDLFIVIRWDRGGSGGGTGS